MPAPRLLLPAIALLAAFLSIATAGQAQVWNDTMVAVGTLPRIGGVSEDRIRILQNLGLRGTDGFLLRSASASRPARTSAGPVQWTPVLPSVTSVWNSKIPMSGNDGPLWAGRGLNGSVSTGIRASAGPIRVIVAPTISFSQNGSLDGLLPDSMGFGGVVAPWRSGIYSADLPVRFGNEGQRRLDWGESSLVAGALGAEAGIASETQWWGPGVRNAIVMSDNAGGFPHLFLRTASPLRTGIGDLEAKWIVGRLTESAYFDSLASNDHRPLSGLVMTYRPAAEPDLTLGLTRVVYGSSGRGLDAFGHAFDVVTFGRGNVAAAVDSLPDSDREQILSLFGRWVFFEEGLELYAEWARTELPASLRDLLARPYHSQGYLLGGQWAHLVRPRGLLRVQTELLNLEQSSTALRRYTPRFYTSPTVPQGYTHRGQVIGASLGPGSSSQYAGVDYLAQSWQAGVFAERIRWDNDAYYTRANYAFGHDVSVLGGARGAVRLPWGVIEAELTSGTRYDYLFQNTAFNHETAADSAVDVRNHTLRLVVTPTLRSRRAEPVDSSPPPLPPARPTAGLVRAAEPDH